MSTSALDPPAEARGPIDRLTYLFENIPLPLEGSAKPPLEQLP